MDGYRSRTAAHGGFHTGDCEKMADDEPDDYRQRRGLVQTTDPEVFRPVWRKPGLDGIASVDDMDRAIGEFLRRVRERQGLTREETASLIGLSGQVYGRYERAESRMAVTRLVHLWETIGFEPLEMLHEIAPHMFGETKENARNMADLLAMIAKMKPSSVETLLRLVKEIKNEP